MKIQFIKMGINGEGIGYINKKPVFCSGVLPSETADVDIIEDRGTFAKAELKKILVSSKDRIKNNCSEEEECSGATLSVLKYDAQLTFKKQLLEEALWKYGHVRSTFVRDARPSPAISQYRTACKLPVQESHGELVTGMYRPGTNHFVPIKYFFDHTEDLEKTRKAVLKVLNNHRFPAFDLRKKSGLRYLILRTIHGKSQLTLITGNDTIREDLLKDLASIEGMVTIAQSINTKKKTVQPFGSKTKALYGPMSMPVEMNGLKLSLSPESFFQLNVSQAEALYKTAIDKVDPCDRLVEAYCGVGVMSLLASSKAKEVIGIETISDAVRNAQANAEENGIKNVKFICDDAAQGLMRLQNVDCLLVDPPRSGLDEAMLDAIMHTEIKKIVYVSCNPATLGKNLKILKQRYQVRTVIPFDMFPDTPHIESITVLERG